MTSRAAASTASRGDAGPDGGARRPAARPAARRSTRAKSRRRLADGVGAGASRSSSRRASCRRCRRRPGRRPRSPGRTARGAGWRRWGRTPTMTKSTVACPSARIASAMSRPTSRSVRPARSHCRTCACTRSIAAPAARSASTSAARLAHPQLAQDRAGEHLLGAGHRGPESAAPSRPTCGRRADHGAGTGERASHQRVRVVGLAPGARISTPSAADGRRLRRPAARGRARPRPGRPPAGRTRQVSRSSGMAS